MIHISSSMYIMCLNYFLFIKYLYLIDEISKNFLVHANQSNRPI